ncbi:MAG: hypothetical protein P8Y36_11230 [Alphaproteobacteria bacterium]
MPAARRSAPSKGIPIGSDDHTLKLWDVATGEELRTFRGHSSHVNSVAFSPDGSTVVSGGAGETLAILPDGRTVITGSADYSLKLWDVASGKELSTLTGHSDTVQSVAFSPNGRTALSGSWDKTLKLWDLTPYLFSASARR